MRTYKFQLKPNKIQKEILLKTFDMCRFTYNQLLEKLNNQEKIDRSVIQHHIVELKDEYSELKSVYAKTLQYECYRLFSNLKGLSQSKKKNRKVGRLRFKGKNWFKTIVYNQSGFKLVERDKHYNILHLSKIGDIKILQHRKIDGDIKGIIIKKRVNNWEAHIITNSDYTINSGDGVIGIDMGVLSFITTSSDEKIDNPLYMNKSLKKIQVLHKKLSRTKKGSKNRRRMCVRLQKLWEHINNQKIDFFHKITTILIKKSKHIGVEDLNIKGMVTKTNKNRYYNMRNILDSSWGLFLRMLQFKADSASCEVIKVNPVNTTKRCNKCGSIKNMKLSDRIYICSNCGLVIDRDYNAAINILKLSIGSVRAFVDRTVIAVKKQEAITSNL